MTHQEKMKQIRTTHPFPWRDVVHPNGLIQMIDAAGREVGIFEMVHLAVIVTHTMNTQPEKPE